MDQELERRGHAFVRYADDCNIYVPSERAGQRVMAGVSRFLTEKLKFKVNTSKSAVARPSKRKFLGFSFTRGKEPKRRVAPKALDRFKEKIRALTSRTQGQSLRQMKEPLNRYVRGWRGYFGFCQTPSVLGGLDGWIRRRLRRIAWKPWKKGTRRFAELTNQAGHRQGLGGANRGKLPRPLADQQEPGPLLCTA